MSGVAFFSGVVCAAAFPYFPTTTVAKRKELTKTKPRRTAGGGRRGAAAASEKRWRLLRPRWALRLVALGLLAGVLVCGVYAFWASFYDLAGLKSMPQRTLVYDYQGRPFSRLAGEDRITIPGEQVAPAFVEALLVREDSRFYHHFGVDPIGIARAVVRNALHFHAKEGASTLTQQLARNSFSLGGRNLHRKLLEAFVAIRIELHLSKEEILECYMNRIYFGSGFWGVETASRAYFGKSSAKLTLSEAAILAGLIRSPNRFSPFRNPEGALSQRDTVLGRMRQLGYITEAEETAARAEPLRLAEVRPPGAEQNYVIDNIEQELALILDDDQLAEGGLRVFTAIDPQIQQAAQSALDEELTRIESTKGYAHLKRADFVFDPKKSATPYLQGAVMVIDNATGGIRAMVGGRDYAQSRFNRALLSYRQVGSTFKPFVYAAAYSSRVITPGSPISDGPIRRGEIRNAPNWKPGNSDGSFRGVLPAADGLILSRNTMSVRVGNRAGIDAVCRLAQGAGLNRLPRFPSVYLGSFDATLKEMTSAYTIFPNRGMRREPYLIDQVLDPTGRLLYRAPHRQSRVLDARAAASVDDALHKVVERGTASGAHIRGNAAGKTGTTNDYRDAWFIGYTPALTCGVWVGLDKPARIMDRGYGATLALPVWVRVVNTPASPASPAAEVVRAKATPETRKALPVRVLRSVQHFFEGEKK